MSVSLVRYVLPVELAVGAKGVSYGQQCVDDGDSNVESGCHKEGSQIQPALSAECSHRS